MGQYYLPYVKTGNQITVFDNKVDGQWTGLKLMEHSYWRNDFVGNVIKHLYYNRSRVCWVGDYYDEDDYYQQNCDDAELIAQIGGRVWNEGAKLEECHKADAMFLDNKILVNHTKKIFIRGNDYYERNKVFETWNGETYDYAINPLPLLTCTASHSGGSYYGVNREECGSWFFDRLEVIDDNKEEIDNLLEQGYIEDTTLIFKE